MKPAILITMGDYNGIGPEVALKSVSSPLVRSICRPFLVGSLDVFDYYARRLRLPARLAAVDGMTTKTPRGFIPVLRSGKGAIGRIRPGSISAASGKRSAGALERAAALCLAGDADGMVTAPVSKEAMFRSGYPYPGQTEFVAIRSKARSHAMILVAGRFRVALATIHIPLAQVPRALSMRKIAGKLRLVDATLRRDFAIRAPRIAVLGLNPHAGENGHIGKEELRVIIPAIRSARRRGIRAEGPFPSDGFFGSGGHRSFDAVLAMYHDQGLIPLKMAGFNAGVNFTAGLEIVRTSPDHGTAFDIAGKGIADPGSMIEAIRLAASIILNRRRARG
jgi:4-hydroxythreonine-4-phosphate dehydrogenase